MAITTLILESNASENERRSILLNAVREHFNNPDIEITYSPKGQPKLVGINKFVSVTVIEDKMFAAISDSEIGFDGEHISKYQTEEKTDYAAIAERFFTDEEADYVRNGDDMGVRFCKIWVRKEAYCKYTGKGLADFASFSVTDGEKLFTRIGGVSVKRFQVNFPGSNEYTFAVAGD